MRVVLNVGRVTLWGVDASQRDKAIADLRQSLVEHFSTPEAAAGLTGLSNRPTLRATMPPRSGPKPDSIGKLAGRAIGRALTP